MHLTYAKSEVGSTMSAHKFVNYALYNDLNNPCVPIEDNIMSELDARGDAYENAPIDEADNMWIGGEAGWPAELTEGQMAPLLPALAQLGGMVA